MLGLNQSQLAARLGVTRAAVSKWEKGISPGLANAAKLARLTGIDAGDWAMPLGRGQGGKP